MDGLELMGQARLIETVIKPGICVRCGACVGFCPYFHYFDGHVVAMNSCDCDTWRCVDICPRVDRAQVPTDSPGLDQTETDEMGPFERICMARAKEESIYKQAQYGGAVSALIIYALEKGLVKGAVMTNTGGSLAPEGVLVENRTAVLACAGSRYSASASLSTLNQALKAGKDKLAMVGLPCQMEALTLMSQLDPEDYETSRGVALKIGLFCTWALDYRRLEAFLKEKGLDPVRIKFDIPPPPAQIFCVKTQEGRNDFPLSHIRPFIQKGCSLCEDMTAEKADVSVGSVEGLEGWNTLVVRTRAGVESVDGAVKDGWLEIADLPLENLEHLKEAAVHKREKGKDAQKHRGAT